MLWSWHYFKADTSYPNVVLVFSVVIIGMSPSS